MLIEIDLESGLDGTVDEPKEVFLARLELCGDFVALTDWSAVSIRAIPNVFAVDETIVHGDRATVCDASCLAWDLGSILGKLITFVDGKVRPVLPVTNS
jgi:hypothetical protein